MNNTFLLSVGSVERLRDVAEPLPVRLNGNVFSAMLNEKWTKFNLEVSADTEIPAWVREYLTNYTEFLVWQAEQRGTVVQDVQGMVDAYYPKYLYVSEVEGTPYCTIGTYDEMFNLMYAPRVGLTPSQPITRKQAVFLNNDLRAVIGNMQNGVTEQTETNLDTMQTTSILRLMVGGEVVEQRRATTGTESVRIACAMDKQAAIAQ